MRVILGLLLALSIPARAQEAPAAAPAPAPVEETPTTFHKGQFGLSARLGIGVRGIATYKNTIWCGKTDPEGEFMMFASVCTGRTPFALDLEASYGVAQSIEVTLELRIGVERDVGASPTADGPFPLRLAPGVRFFFSEAKRSKLFVQPQLLFDFTGHKDFSGASRGFDFGLRAMEGFWLDLHRSYGIYIYVAESFEAIRWLSFTFEAGLGFQGRYP